MSKINCTFCNTKFGIKAFKNHLEDCISETQNTKSGYLIEFSSSSYITKKYYSMFAIFGLNCTFKHIDKFLKNKWCECCNHMSILNVCCLTNDKFNCDSIKFNILISKYENADHFNYEYDMGTTTKITFKIIKKLDGIETNNNVELVYQNEVHKLKCKCKKEALFIYEDALVCKECSLLIDEDEEIFTPIVNSPRIGLCGYVGF